MQQLEQSGQNAFEHIWVTGEFSVRMRVSYLTCAVFLCGVHGRMMNSTEPPQIQLPDLSLSAAVKLGSSSGVHRVRRRRFISQSDMVAILNYHNQVRANVFPPAANMEYMVRENRCNQCYKHNDFIWNKQHNKITAKLLDEFGWNSLVIIKLNIIKNSDNHDHNNNCFNLSCAQVFHGETTVVCLFKCCCF